MRRLIANTIAATTIGVVLLMAVAAVAVPTLRHIASGWWNSPEGLAALPDNPQVHYESGAFEQARIVAGLLPYAIARVEAVHVRRFAYPVTVGVYVTLEAFVAANGLGDRQAAGMTFLGRVMLSPVLFSAQRQHLSAMLTHELSHAHLRSWISQLSVMASAAVVQRGPCRHGFGGWRRGRCQRVASARRHSARRSYRH
jgi:hypothetical protein